MYDKVRVYSTDHAEVTGMNHHIEVSDDGI